MEKKFTNDVRNPLDKKSTKWCGDRIPVSAKGIAYSACHLWKKNEVIVFALSKIVSQPPNLLQTYKRNDLCENYK